MIKDLCRRFFGRFRRDGEARRGMVKDKILVIFFRNFKIDFRDIGSLFYRNARHSLTAAPVSESGFFFYLFRPENRVLPPNTMNGGFCNFHNAAYSVIRGRLSTINRYTGGGDEHSVWRCFFNDLQGEHSSRHGRNFSGRPDVNCVDGVGR